MEMERSMERDAPRRTNQGQSLVMGERYLTAAQRQRDATQRRNATRPDQTRPEPNHNQNRWENPAGNTGALGWFFGRSRLEVLFRLWVTVFRRWWLQLQFLPLLFSPSLSVLFFFLLRGLDEKGGLGIGDWGLGIRDVDG